MDVDHESEDLDIWWTTMFFLPVASTDTNVDVSLLSEIFCYRAHHLDQSQDSQIIWQKNEKEGEMCNIC
jgi:hypothetical protein